MSYGNIESKPEYLRSAEEFAGNLGIDPATLLRNISNRSMEHNYPTPDCLTVSEVSEFERLRHLQPDRKMHLDGCASCRSLLGALVNPLLFDEFQETVRQSHRMSNDPMVEPQAARHRGSWGWPTTEWGLAAACLLFASVMATTVHNKKGTDQLAANIGPKSSSSRESAPVWIPYQSSVEQVKPKTAGERVVSRAGYPIARKAAPLAADTRAAHLDVPTAPAMLYKPRREHTERGGFVQGVLMAGAGAPVVLGGRIEHPTPAGSREMHGPSGDVRMRADGRPMDVHDARHGIYIHHDLIGGQRILIELPGGRHTYYERGQPGYVESPYMANGREFKRRSYYYQGRAYDQYYSQYSYRGYTMAVYAPARYYPVSFYGWVYNSWVTPVAYAWGFAAEPWHHYYGSYFTPYLVYSSASLWLTDYLISQQLAEAYQAQQERGVAAAAYAGSPLSPDVKQMVATEVQRQIALEHAEAQQNAQRQTPDPRASGIARLLEDGQSHVFVVGKEIDVVDASGQECAVTGGDVLQLTTPPGGNERTARVLVLSSKDGMDCKRAATVEIALDELQDINNQMREKLDQGLQELQAKQGKRGLPPAPPSALAHPVRALIAENAPPPDQNEAQEIAQQAQAAESAEKEVLAQTGTGAEGDVGAAVIPAAPAAATVGVSISPGETTDQVTAALGAPSKRLNLRSKEIYIYKDMTVTFVKGKVTTIE